jgi:hypothetical protein
MNSISTESGEVSSNQGITIKEAMRQERVIFVHGIHATLWTKSNSLLNKSATWQDKLDIALYLRPNLSVSSIKSGEQGNNLFSRMGLILADGNLEQMYSVDAGSKPKNLQIRNALEGIKQSTLHEAVNRKNKPAGSAMFRPYNEFIVSHPTYAGFFYCTDANFSDQSLVSFAELMPELAKRQIPLYLLEKGKLYQTANGVKAELAEKIDPILVDSQRTELEVKRLLANSVFDIQKLALNNDDLRRAFSFGCGQEAYLSYIESRYNKFFKYNEEQFPHDETAFAQKAKLLASIAIGNVLNSYYLFSTRAMHERIIRVSKRYNDNSLQISCEQKKPNVANIGISGNIALRMLSEDPSSHAMALLSAIKNYQSDAQVMLECDAYLAGFARSASIFYDDKTTSLINNYLGSERLFLPQEAYDKRIGVDGRLVLLESDLFKYDIH